MTGRLDGRVSLVTGASRGIGRAIARALANQPPLLLADEPCASLDATTAQTVLILLLAVCREVHTTLLLVSHEDTVRDAADQVLDLAAINHAAG